jgi:AraC family transcriptional regulator, ethanolamine operon transcriptional activator
VGSLKATNAFDFYVDSIREATLLFIKTGPSRAKWDVEWYQFGRINLQLGSDGGPRVVHGIGRNDAVTFMFHTSKTPHQVFFDGYTLTWRDVCVVSPGAHFTFASRTPTRWFALTMPTGLIEDPNLLREQGVSFSNRNVAITLAEDSVVKLMTTAKGARDRAKKSGDKRQPIDVATIESTLLTALDGSLVARKSKLRLPSRHQASVESTVTRALEYMRSRNSENVHVEEIARAADVSSRGLQRSFQTYLRMAPKEYLKFRQLNLVRRGLRLDPSTEGSKNNVTRILANYGVSEFGRFAAEYRRLFHELPSQTFARRKG